LAPAALGDLAALAALAATALGTAAFFGVATGEAGFFFRTVEQFISRRFGEARCPTFRIY